MQELYYTLELLRWREIERRKFHGLGYPPWPADMAFSESHSPAYVGAQFPEDNQGTISSDADVPTVAMDDVLAIITRNGSVRYRCPCGSEMAKSSVARHLKSKMHLSPQFPCVCGRRFTRKDTLKAHKRKRMCHEALST